MRIDDITIIQHVNKTLIVLRHFIELSSKILPHYAYLKQKRHPTPLEVNQMNKIAHLYQQQNIDSSISQILLNSDILKIIHDSFTKIQNASYESLNNSNFLEKFWQEYEKLTKNWNYSLSN